MLIYVSVLNYIVNYLCSYVHETGIYTSNNDNYLCSNITLYTQYS